MKYSIVVPFHNEQDSVLELYQTTLSVMEAIADDFEFVFVDDGSRDRTFAILEELSSRDRRVVVVKLRRNYGQTGALLAGFEQATGDCIVAMDGDLQHDPTDIPLFLQKIDEGYDVVCGRRTERPGDSWLLRKVPSKVANTLMAKLSGVAIHDFGTGFKAYRTEVIRQIPLYGELHRFIPALAAKLGASICEVPIHLNERKHGTSHYGIKRAVPVMFDLITIPFLLRYISRPMHFFGGMGLSVLGLGFSVSLFLLYRLLSGISLYEVHGPLMFFTAVLLLAGLQLMCLGFLGEMQVRHFHQGNVAQKGSEVARVIRNK